MKNFANPDGLVREDFPGGWPTDTVDKFTPSGRSVVENDLFGYVKKLATYRRDNPVLQTGKLMQYVPEDAIYVYFRYDGDKTVMVVMNTAEESRTVSTGRFTERIQTSTRLKDIITGEVVDVKAPIRLAAKTTAVFEVLK